MSRSRRGRRDSGDKAGRSERALEQPTDLRKLTKLEMRSASVAWLRMSRRGRFANVAESGSGGRGIRGRLVRESEGYGPMMEDILGFIYFGTQG